MLNNIITTVLKREGKIALPSIGIIVRADFDGETTYLFTPMAVKADGNIISAIMTEMELSQCEAANVLDCYVDFVRGVIVKNGKYRIQGVGDIMRNESNVYYFTPSNNVVPTPPVAAIVEEVKEDILKNEIVLEEIADSPSEPVEESDELKAERMNERFQSKRLGEIIEGGANKRFYDKVHSQVVSEKEEVIQEEMKQEAVPPKRKGLYDIYDKGFKHDVPPAVKPIVPPVATPPAVPPVIETQQAAVVSPVASVSQPVEVVMPKKKKTDAVLVVSIIVIIVGLAFIGYFYYMQQTIEL